MSEPSFERFDYQLRSNKHIERKLVFDLLVRAKKHIDFESYKYLGLGSMWFADHRLAHRQLGMNRLISFEASEHAERAKFNKPFHTVEVIPGLSNDVLRQWSSENWDAPMVVWMDYDGPLVPDVVNDLEVFCEKLQPNSVLITSVNAYYQNYRIKNEAALAAEKRGEKIDRRAIATLQSMLGNVVPEKYSSRTTQKTNEPADVKQHEFPPCLADSLLAFLSHKVTALGRQNGTKLLKFLPLFNFCHKDGVEMVTVGGVICDEQTEKHWIDALFGNPMLARPESPYPLHHRLDLIPITLREKLALDSNLPMDKASFLTEVTAQGLQISADQIEKYRQHYRFFPMFIEAPV